MHYSISIALKYLRTKRRRGFISRVTAIAIIGTLVGVATLIIVLSLMNGFENELRSRIVEFNTHILVFARTPGAWAKVDSAATLVESVPGVIATSPFIRGEALIYYDVVPGVRVKTKGAIVKGLDLGRERKVSTVIDSIAPPITSFEAKGFDDGKDLPGIVLGKDLADELLIYFGEVLTLVTAPAEFKAGKMEPQTQEFRVIGFFRTGVYEFDSRFVYIGLDDAERFFDFESATHGLGVRIKDIYAADKVDARILNLLDSPAYGTNNWIQMNRNLFSYIKVEKILMFLLLTLIILIAAFNLVAMLTMVIMEKRNEIGILRSMGASSRGVMSIFMFQGTFIGAVGTAIGAVLGLLICGVLREVKIDLPPDVYFINTLPVLVSWADVVMVCGASMAICFLATIYPSWEACRMPPLDAIRYD
ncbi:MAG: FtsX-like permease family protein [Candidatus Krumholzibacteria bacterium]|nr:FtsX-like permease family protein [Candidatus Krumholzibacteria bacterium]